MKSVSFFLTTIILSVCLSISAFANGRSHEFPLMLQFADTGALMSLDDALAMAGVDLAHDTSLSQAEIDEFSVQALGCWPNAMLDARTQRQVGFGIDCLELLPGSDPAVGVLLRALSVFVFNHKEKSALVTLGLTTVRPFIAGVGDADGGVTHLTGSIPSGPGGIVGGTGVFKGATGTARVSGAVNLSAFPDEILFDCLWRLGVKLPWMH